MSNHRFWRAIRIVPLSQGELELTEFHLLNSTGVRVDAAATLSASVAPSSGALANLSDDSLATGATWAAPTGLTLQWDFGVGNTEDVEDIRLGSADVFTKFPISLVMQWSDDGTTWSTLQGLLGIKWPGARAKTTSIGVARWGVTVGTGAVDATGLIASASTYPGGVFGNDFKSSGIKQFEITLGSNALNAGAAVGVAIEGASLSNGVGFSAGSWVWSTNASVDSTFYAEGVGTTYGARFEAGDVVGVVVNFTTGQLTFYKNGVSQGAIGSGFGSRIVCPLVGVHNDALTTFTLRTRDFVYPAAGATAWEPRDLIERVPTTSVASTDIFIASLGATPPLIITEVTDQLKDRGDYYVRGTGRVFGTVKVDGTPDAPVRRRVRLYRDKDGLLIREQWSNATTGAYDFQYLKEDELYTVISYDYTASFRAVVADQIVPDIMP